MGNFEKRIIDKILNNLDILIFIFITIIGLSLRYFGRDFITADMAGYLIPWFNKIKSLGGLSALSQQVGNYGILYQAIIALMTYINFEPLYMYKILSVIFDFSLAIACAVLICNIKKEKKFSFTFNLVYALILCLPMFVFDSGWWGQCDSIYVFFIIISLIMLFKEKYISSFVFLGVALSFKLQTVFILPFYFLEYIKERKFSILLFLIPTIVLLISGLPAALAGRSIFAPYEIYLNQTSDYKQVSINFNSFWNLVGNDYRWIKWLSIFTTIFALVVIIYYLIKNNCSYNNKIKYAVLLTWTVLLFLPNMHERYDYLLSVLLVMQLILDRKYFGSIVISLVLSTMTYSWALFGWNPYNEGVTQLTTIMAILAYFLYIRMLLKDNN